MVALRLPESPDPEVLKHRLFEEYLIEVPVYTWNEMPIIRLSFQAYNQPRDLEILLDALKILLPQTEPGGEQ